MGADQDVSEVRAGPRAKVRTLLRSHLTLEHRASLQEYDARRGQEPVAPAAEAQKQRSATLPREVALPSRGDYPPLPMPPPEGEARRRREPNPALPQAQRAQAPSKPWSDHAQGRRLASLSLALGLAGRAQREMKAPLRSARSSGTLGPGI